MCIDDICDLLKTVAVTYLRLAGGCEVATYPMTNIISQHHHAIHCFPAFLALFTDFWTCHKRLAGQVANESYKNHHEVTNDIRIDVYFSTWEMK